MPFARKAGPAFSLNISGDIPRPPSVPDAVVERFPEMSQWEAQFQQWWKDYASMSQRDRDSINTQFKQDEAQAASNLATTNSSLSSLSTQLAALAASLSGSSLSSQLAALAANLAQVAADLLVHVQAYAAHGVTGRVVGTTDAQDLDSKTIGETVPGYGRFVAGAIGRSTVLGSDSIAIGPDDQLVVAGPLDVTGVLTVEGTLLVL